MSERQPTVQESLAAIGQVANQLTGEIIRVYGERLRQINAAEATKRPVADEQRASGTRTQPEAPGVNEGDE